MLLPAVVVVVIVVVVVVVVVHSSKEGAVFGAPTDLHSASMVR